MSTKSTLISTLRTLLSQAPQGPQAEALSQALSQAEALAEVTPSDPKRSGAARQAWETRRAIQRGERPPMRERALPDPQAYAEARRGAARKAWETRRERDPQRYQARQERGPSLADLTPQELAERLSGAARKAWETRRARRGAAERQALPPLSPQAISQAEASAEAEAMERAEAWERSQAAPQVEIPQAEAAPQAAPHSGRRERKERGGARRAR